MTTLRLDSPASQLAVRTRASGMLARLAHDLELTTNDLRGQARLDGDAWSAELEIPVAGFRVAGTLHGERLDPAGLSSSDRREVERRIREDVLRGTDAVRVRASGPRRDRADLRLELSTGSVTTSTPLLAQEQPGGAVRVTGSCPLSLRAMGVREIKGPLGAFKVQDQIEIRFDLTLRPEG